MDLGILTRGESRIPAALHGNWVVERQGVLSGGASVYGNDTAELVGAKLSITATGAAWDAGNAEALRGACSDAYFDGETEDADASPDTAAMLAGAKAVGASGDKARVLHFLCMGEGSNWGADGDTVTLTVLSDGRLAVPYTDGLVLVLKRAG